MSIALEMTTLLTDRGRLLLSLVAAVSLVCAVVSTRSWQVKMDALRFPKSRRSDRRVLRGASTWVSRPVSYRLCANKRCKD